MRRFLRWPLVLLTLAYLWAWGVLVGVVLGTYLPCPWLDWWIP